MTDLELPVAAIPDGGARVLPGADPSDPGLIVTRSEQCVSAFRNDCPHAHLPLELVPGRVTARDGRHLLCANHGALFRMRDGFCVHGPCRGQRLVRLGVTVIDAHARIRPDPSSRAAGRQSW